VYLVQLLEGLPAPSQGLLSGEEVVPEFPRQPKEQVRTASEEYQAEEEVEQAEKCLLMGALEYPEVPLLPMPPAAELVPRAVPLMKYMPPPWASRAGPEPRLVGEAGVSSPQHLHCVPLPGRKPSAESHWAAHQGGIRPGSVGLPAERPIDLPAASAAMPHCWPLPAIQNAPTALDLLLRYQRVR